VAVAAPEDAPDLARVANDELKKICDGRPNNFPAWVASLPLNNVEASLEEMDGAMAARQPEKSALDTCAGGRLGGRNPIFRQDAL